MGFSYNYEQYPHIKGWLLLSWHLRWSGYKLTVEVISGLIAIDNNREREREFQEHDAVAAHMQALLPLMVHGKLFQYNTVIVPIGY